MGIDGRCHRQDWLVRILRHQLRDIRHLLVSDSYEHEDDQEKGEGAAVNLHVYFIQRKESYPGQYAPEAMAIADEYTMDENPEYLEEQILGVKNSVGMGAIAGDAVVVIKVDQDTIRRRCFPSEGAIKGEVVEEKKE